jgi:nitric oxide reductase NorD protein
MELDQLIFKRLHQYFQKRKQKTDEENEHKVELQFIRRKLLIIARALTGEAIDIQISEREGGWQGLNFFLPPSISLFSELDRNLQFYLYRVFYLSVQSQLDVHLVDPNADVARAQELSQINSDKVLRQLELEYPLVHLVYLNLANAYSMKVSKEEQDWTWFFGRLMKENVQLGAKHLKHQPNSIEAGEKDRIETEIAAQHADEVTVVTIDKKAQEDYVLTHNFEKAETVDEFDGLWRDFDGDDSLNEDLDALQDLHLKHLVRVDDPVHSIYKTEMSVGTIAETDELLDKGFHLSYPEWDYRKGAYLNNHCKVFPVVPSALHNAYYHETLEHHKKVLFYLRRVFSKIHNDLEQVRRLPQGEEFDIDALTDVFIDMHNKKTPSDNIYTSKRKRKKEFSLLFLLDLSLSSDGYAHGNRILDIEKQVAILFGEIMNEFDMDFEIDGFFSKTRNMTQYVHLKAFDENWNNAVHRIGSAEPAAYTRIGSALRHAGTLLDKRAHRKKWLIILSDGKPNDYDKYEGKHGIHDIKQALKELKAKGINSYAVAIEEQAKYYLPQMFGHNHYNILSSPIEMIHSLTSLYQKIEKGR